MTPSILDTLQRDRPAFQLKSGNEKVKSSEEFLSKAGAQSTEALERASHASTMAVLRYLSEHVTSKSVSAETGGGWSTCVLASGGGTHYCVNPDATANQMIREFLTRQGFATSGLHFIAEPSDQALPKLPPEIRLDLCYVDGSHSYPLPIIDWHYLDLHLRKDGLMLIDDVHINAVKVLCDFLDTEPAYRLEHRLETTWVYRKVRDSREWGWGDQPFNRPGFLSRLKTKVRRAIGRA